MGLFYTQAGADARGKTGKKVIKITVAEQKLLNCSHCPLDNEPLNSPKMPPTGADNPELYMLGEAPGKTEDETGQQFVGDSGSMIRDRIPIRWDRKIRWNNTLRCRPPKNRDPAPLEVACCRRLQEEDIERSKPKVIAGFGNVPLHWMLGSDRQISVWRGRRMPVKVGSHVCWYYPITHPSYLLRSENDRKKGEAYKRTFERDIERLFLDLDKGLPSPYVESDYLAGVTCVTDYGIDGLKQIEDFLAMIKDEEHGNDIETNMLRPYNPERKILSIAAGTYERTLAFGWHHREAMWAPKHLKILTDIVEAYLLGDGLKWAHSSKFEQEWYRSYFGPKVLYRTAWGCTLAQAHTLDERAKAKALDDLTQLWFGFRVKSLSRVDVKNLANEPLSEVLPYNGMDAKYCHALSIVQDEEILQLGLGGVFGMLNEAQPALVQMQAKGVVRNLPAIKTLDTDLTKQEAEITKKILANRDVADFMRTAAGAKFKPGSPQAVAALFRDFLKIPHPDWRSRKEGGYSVDEEALAKIKHPAAALIKSLRTVGKNHGYVTPLLDGGKYVHADGLVHASYSNLVAVSGREACEDPNQQNYPRRQHKEIRRVVGCPPGHVFAAFDYRQLEARVVACIANDQVLKAEIRNGQDIHGDWTESIGGHFIPAKVATERKKIRDSIKQYWTFANFYGNVLEAVAADLSREFGVTVSPDALEPYFIEFWNRYAGVLAWQGELMTSYWTNGWVATATGQRRHEPMSRNELINHPIQGTAGHLVIDAQGRLSRIAYEEDIPPLQPIMNIHDDLSFYLPKDMLEELIEFIAEQMIRCPFDFIDVPLGVEVSIGDNWADKEEIAIFSTEDFT